MKRDDAREKHLEFNGAVLSLVMGDIIAQSADAIVNAANPGLMGGGGVDGAIHQAGGPAILDECKRIIAKHGPLQTGEAVITTAGDLKAKFVIHTVGPIWLGGRDGESELLASAYRNSLSLATDRKLESIAFPSISTGAYMYPATKAAPIAVSEVVKFLRLETTTIRRVVFVLFNQEIFDVYTKVLEAIPFQG